MVNIYDDRQDEELFLWNDEELDCSMCAYMVYDGHQFNIEIYKLLEDGTLELSDEIDELSPRWSFTLELLKRCGVEPERIIQELKLFVFDDDSFDDYDYEDDIEEIDLVE